THRQRADVGDRRRAVRGSGQDVVELRRAHIGRDHRGVACVAGSRRRSVRTRSLEARSRRSAETPVDPGGTDAMTEVRHIPENYVFAIIVDDEMAGYTEYRTGPGVRAFMHTIIDEKFRGQGLA